MLLAWLDRRDEPLAHCRFRLGAALSAPTELLFRSRRRRRSSKSGGRVSVSLSADFGAMPSDASTIGERLVRRLHAAMNAHDIEAFVGCFAEDYDSAQPAHPDRAFRGREQVRANWSAVFAGVPDFRAELVRVDAVGDTAWSEWRWEGTQTDGARLDMAGVIVLGVRDDRFAWARLYVEPVEQAGAGIDEAVRDITGER